jgi:hypothetical protein
VSDAPTPHSDDNREDNVPVEEAVEPDVEPIDVAELLESTRQLFEPEELQRAMEQAGYTPEPPTSGADKSPDDVEETGETRQETTSGQVANEPETPTGDQDSKDQPASGGDETTPESDVAVAVTTDGGDQREPDDQAADDLAEGEIGHEEPPLTGFNILSIVAFVLALALSPLAVVFGYIALGQTRRARQRGETLALWAIGLGWLVFAAWVVLIASLLWIGSQEGVTLDSLREFIDLFSLP